MNHAHLLRRLAVHPLSLATLAAATIGAAALRHHRAATECDRPGHAACAMPAAPHADSAPAASLPEGVAVLEFTSEYCPACRRLEPVLEDARRQCQKAGAPVVAVDVDSITGTALAAQWGVNGTPTLVFLDAQHEEVGRLVGAQPLADVRHAIEHAYGMECAALPRGTTGPG